MRTFPIVIVVAACASDPTVSTAPGGPRGLRASEHLEAARQHDEQERMGGAWPDAFGLGPNHADQPVGLPWFRSWDANSDDARLAEIHRGQAAALEAAYESACGGSPAVPPSISPLVRYGVGGWPTQSGAIIYLSPLAGTPDQVLAAMKCHRAFMMLAPSDMDDCPLDLPGLELDARGDAVGITVSLTVRDSAKIPELQHRAARELEARQHPETPAAPAADSHHR